MKKSKSILLFFILLLTIFAGCSSLPSESDAKKYLEAKISEESKGNIELVLFQKTNGVELDGFGQKLYDMEFIASVEVTKDGYKKRDGYKSIGSRNFSFDFYEQLPKIDMFDYSVFGSPVSEVKKGQRFELKGAMRYEKTENGWRIAKQLDKDAIQIEAQ
jgi:hypothetical protein